MEQAGMYVEDLYTIPEVRTITPSHLVRAGTTLAYDANFGMTAGAYAVNLLLNPVTNLTQNDRCQISQGNDSMREQSPNWDGSIWVHPCLSLIHI